VSRAADQITTFILASSSPRRQDLLVSAGLAFEVDPAEIDEEPSGNETPAEYVRRLALAKASEVAGRRNRQGDTRPVLAADTIVVIDGEVIGKPPSREVARRQLQRLSGRTHHVITGFCLLRIADPAEPAKIGEVTTEVEFKRLDPDEIEAYLETDEWRDKAGGYAVQGRAAYMVRSVFGSYTNVVGLPLCQAVEALRGLPPRSSSR
jgi:septum formation protein